MSHTSVETFADLVRTIPGGEHFELCYSCGTCVSKCMIQQKVEPEYNPRRLLRLVMEGMKEEAFNSPTTWMCSACDLCFPACPQQIHISGVIDAVKQLAVQSGKKQFLNTAIVNEQTCVACGLCVQVCPYDAIQIIEKKVNFRGLIQVAQVDPSLCMSCGLCGAECRSTSIGIGEDFSDAAMIEKMWRWLKLPGEVAP